MKNANGNIAVAEQRLNEGQIEEALDTAADELSLVAKMIEWKAYAEFYFMSFHESYIFL